MFDCCADLLHRAGSSQLMENRAPKIHRICKAPKNHNINTLYAAVAALLIRETNVYTPRMRRVHTVFIQTQNTNQHVFPECTSFRLVTSGLQGQTDPDADAGDQMEGPDLCPREPQKRE